MAGPQSLTLRLVPPRTGLPLTGLPLTGLPRIAGLEPCSLIDFPGHLAAVLFLRGCNLNCGYCHNRALIELDDTLEGEVSPYGQAAGGEPGLSPHRGASGAHPDCRLDSSPPEPPRPAGLRPAELASFLHERRNFLDGIVVTGGEPTLSPGLPELLRQIRAHGYKVKLDTNGSRPELLAELLAEGLVDFVALDIKAPLADPELYAEVCGLPAARGPALVAAIGRSLALLRDGAAKTGEHQFECRTTCCPELGPAELELIGQELAGVPSWAWQVWRDPAATSSRTRPTAQPQLPLAAANLTRLHPGAAERFGINKILLRG